MFHQSGDIRAVSVGALPEAHPGGQVQVAWITMKLATVDTLQQNTRVEQIQTLSIDVV